MLLTKQNWCNFMQMTNQPIKLIWVLLFVIISTLADAQKRRRKNITIRDSIEKQFDYPSSDYFRFPNVNNIALYYSKKEFKKIKHFNDKKDWEHLYPILRKYVSNFGIENFYKNTYLIWRLAKLTESLGNEDEAILLYRLAINHYRSNLDIKTIELTYDSLNQKNAIDYVPIDYYYELVEYRKQVDTLRPPRGVLLNMGRWINSDFADYAPALNKEDNFLLFTTKRDVSEDPLERKHIENLYYSIGDGLTWETAQPLEGINSELNEGSGTLSHNGKQLFFSRCESPDGFGNCDIYVAEKQEDNGWGNIHNLGTNINSKGWDSHPTLNQSDDTLYFASDRIGGFGLADIYYSAKNEEGLWGEAKNAGPIINTRQNEVSPFFHHKNEVLYFSSNGHLLNFGEFDIFKTKKSNGIWSSAKNIGPLVNGPGSEFYFTIDSKSENLFYSRSAENSMDNLDLYSFPLPMEAQPNANTRLTGTMQDTETGSAIQGIISIIDLDNGIEVAPQFLRPDGSYEFKLINNNNYLVVVQGENFFRIEELIHLESDTQLSTQIEPISTKIKFESIVFGNGESKLTEGMYDDLDKVADFLLDNPKFKLRISGHTDSDGRENFNLKLSQERADAIKEYLIYFGNIDETRIGARGFGSSKPILKEQTEEAKKINRRVEFELYRN
jgi:outer membrane protein OmpA-like peptidoglycan-associated protein